MILVFFLVMPALAAGTSDDMNAAGLLYSQSVDLANEGKYQPALDAADKALAMNVTPLVGLIQSNRAGILVMLDRNDEAIIAADSALAVEGNLTGVHSIAWYNKGNALRNLGRIAEARDSYNHAYALDKTLVPPDLSRDVSVPTTIPAPVTTIGITVKTTATAATASATPTATPTAKSPLSVIPLLAALGVITGVVTLVRKK